MSKIGKKSIAIPAGVEIKLEGGLLSVKGPKGTLTKNIPANIEVKIADGKVNIHPVKSESRQDLAQWGLWRALTNNMIIGVSQGWQETLEFQGVGYKAAVKGKDLELALGYSHPITVAAPEGITFTTDKTSITISGIDKEIVGHTASLIRSKRLPEPYKGSGVRYSDEIIKKKAGKKAATAA
jgi:large subunit ribosomal protein L6